ncbi:hypothetical protein RND71_040723 [Anisodus tanguticus]|uniref:Uncharacterized protein n=1 Tax=Anisodus tanguticus TaxID=243964 RepID=A0AAE1QTJ4_9SOLA|nr:hypothetical protein RND71_040723 [Anisodus tanguticus]
MTPSQTGSVTLPFKGLKPIANRASSIWLYLVPHGMDDSNNALISRKAALKDTKRVNYHNDYLTNLLAAIKEDGCNVKGYFVWSLMDNWEMGSWIFVEVWSLLCGLQGQPQEISQGFRELVQEFLKLCLN